MSPFQEYFLHTTEDRYVDTTITNDILQKGTRGSFRQWDKNYYDLAVTMIQKSYSLGGYGMTPNVITQTSFKVVMTSRFLTTTGCSNNWLFMHKKLFHLLNFFLNHIKSRTNDDRFPLPLWETWFCSSLGVPIPALIEPPQHCVYNVFHYDSYGDHLETCQTKSVDLQVHDWDQATRL
jgi:hypothetical protein